MDILNELLNKEICNSVPKLLNSLNNYYSQKPIISSETITADLINKEFVDEIKNLTGNISISFGKTLRELKCNILDEQGLREHEIFLIYKSSRKLGVTGTNLPYSPLQDRDYSSIEEVAHEFRNHITSLEAYFQELENIDSQCTVMEPTKPTFKDNYRRILLDKKNWLHIEVSPDGSARNIHLIRQCELWNDILHKRLLSWDHDKNIVDNIHYIFDLKNVSPNNSTNIEKLDDQVEIVCGICFCVEWEGCGGVPQPLCQNPNCDVYFHKSCLFEWLVTCAGGCLPTFGVVSGSCPTCLQPISCSEKDN